MIYWTYISYRRATVRLSEFLFWLGAWGVFAFVVLFPSTTGVFLQRLHVNRTLDLMQIAGFMLVWVVLFADHLETRRLRRRLQDLARQNASEKGEES